MAFALKTLPDQGSTSDNQKFSLGSVVIGFFLGVIAVFIGLILSYVVGAGWYVIKALGVATDKGLNQSEALFAAALQGTYAYAQSGFELVIALIAIMLSIFVTYRLIHNRSRMLVLATMTTAIVSLLIFLVISLLPTNF